MPPILIAAGVTAAASIGGAALSAHSSNKAAATARDSELQIAQQNNALTEKFRAENTANFLPTLQSGTRANALLDSFLYAPQAGQTAQPTPAATPVPAQQPTLPTGGAFNMADMTPDYSAGMQAFSPRGQNNLARFQQLHPAVVAATQAVQTAQVPQVTTPAATAPAANALGGYEAFQASPYYQFPLQQGMKALNQGYAARGILQSGAAEKGILKYGQDYAAGRQDEYLGLAERQANRGVAGASAIAGVSQNALNMTTQQNQNSADAIANAALLRAQNNNAMYGSAANALGALASSFKW
jgi:hypothetical protein